MEEINTSKEETSEETIDSRKLKKFSFGEGPKINKLKAGLKRHKLKRKEIKYRRAEKLASRTEILLTEDHGLLEATEDTHTAYILQDEIKKAVDITAATKSFNLNLTDFGPYKFRYSLNGRHLALAGRLGHLASFDWVTKKLHCEINVMESIEDVCFLHHEGMFAAAQKGWTYIYDKQGVELHCLKQFHRMTKLEFLPYHFLLCGGNENGYLSWLDVSLGKEVIATNTLKGKIRHLCQNPYNAVLCCGHSTGVVSMWTPNEKKAVLSLLAHSLPIKGITVDPYGRYLATTALDRRIKIWDTRNICDPVCSYIVGAGASNLAFSQKGLLAVSLKNSVEVYKNATFDSSLYLRNSIGCQVTGVQFCPYEDVLGVSHDKGFSSLLVPGSGEPNFDALERNPYSSRTSRREAEVKALLRKVPYETITLDPLTLRQANIDSIEDQLEAKRKLGFVKVPKIDIQPKYRMKGKSDSAHRFSRKQKTKENLKKEFLKDLKSAKESQLIGQSQAKESSANSQDILDRFKPKKRKI